MSPNDLTPDEARAVLATLNDDPSFDDGLHRRHPILYAAILKLRRVQKYNELQQVDAYMRRCIEDNKHGGRHD